MVPVMIYAVVDIWTIVNTMALEHKFKAARSNDADNYFF